MRKVLIIGLLLASLSGIGQISFSVPIGYSSEKVMVIGSNLQWNIGHFIIAGGFDAHVTSKVSSGDIFWSRVGGSVNIGEKNSLEITAGIGNYIRASNIKSEKLGLFSVYYVHPIDPKYRGALFGGVTTTNQFAFVSAGLRFIFGKKERDGCPSTWVR